MIKICLVKLKRCVALLLIKIDCSSKTDGYLEIGIAIEGE